MWSSFHKYPWSKEQNNDFKYIQDSRALEHNKCPNSKYAVNLKIKKSYVC